MKYQRFNKKIGRAAANMIYEEIEDRALVTRIRACTGLFTLNQFTSTHYTFIYIRKTHGPREVPRMDPPPCLLAHSPAPEPVLPHHTYKEI